MYGIAHCACFCTVACIRGLEWVLWVLLEHGNASSQRFEPGRLQATVLMTWLGKFLGWCAGVCAGQGVHVYDAHEAACRRRQQPALPDHGRPGRPGVGFCRVLRGVHARAAPTSSKRHACALGMDTVRDFEAGLVGLLLLGMHSKTIALCNGLTIARQVLVLLMTVACNAVVMFLEPCLLMQA